MNASTQRSAGGLVGGVAVTLSIVVARATFESYYIGSIGELTGWMGLPVLLWDERWSTQAVTRTLIDADASRARRAELVDKMAAAYILQGAIDALTMG